MIFFWKERSYMDRGLEMEEYIKEYRSERKKSKRVFLNSNETELNSELCLRVDYLVKEQVQKQVEEKQDKIKYLLLCRLLSGAYTENYEAILGLSSSLLYLDENKSLTYWRPALIYDSIDRDMKEVEKLLNKGFIRLQEYELFRLKQKLLNDDWELLKECFPRMIERNLGMITESNLLMEKQFLVLCGDYMEELPVIWMTYTQCA